MNFDYNNTVEFWKWFQLIANQLKGNLNNPQLLKKLDSLIYSMGKFEWEVGPVDETICYLAISPNLNRELLSATRQIINLAPACNGWQFLPAKPAKKPQPIFHMLNESGHKIIVDTSNWEYVLYQFSDNTFSIDLKINHIDCNKDFKNLAVDIALTNLLGEERYIEFVNDVKIVTLFKNENNVSLFEYLDKHILIISGN